MSRHVVKSTAVTSNAIGDHVIVRKRR